MPDTQFKATLEMLIPLVIKEITKSRNINEQEAFGLLYSSFLYSKLEVGSTKLWHLSQLTLANLLNEEFDCLRGVRKYPETNTLPKQRPRFRSEVVEEGSITFPEEA